MTSLQWIYEEGADGHTRLARTEAMAYADEALRGVVTVKNNPSEVEREALRVRKGELTWSDRQTVKAGSESSTVAPVTSMKTIMWGVFWGGILLSVVDAILYALLRAMS